MWKPEIAPMQPERLRQLALRLAAWLEPRGLGNAKARSIVLAIASLFLLAGIAVALRHRPEVWYDLDWRPVMLVVLVAVPVTVVLNGLEFMLMGRLVGRDIGFFRALEISIIGTAANLLPLPGATLVRVAGLKAAGAGYGDGTLATLIVAGIWVGVAFSFAGLWMSGADPSWISIAFLVFGGSIWFGCFLAAMRRCRGVELPVLLSLAKLLLVATDVFRIYLCFLALGEAAHFAQAAAFAVAAVLGSAVSVVPAGLGVREAVSAALAPLVGLAPALGFLAASLNRLLDLVTVLPIACLLLVFARLQSRDHGAWAAARNPSSKAR